MNQIALPIAGNDGSGPSRIVAGNANESVLDACRQTRTWPFRTAILFGPPRSGKSLIARWFVENGLGDAIDDADSMDETELFHSWNRAQENGMSLLLVCNGAENSWKIKLPDLASRLGAALHLSIGEPDDAMVADLIALHAEQRNLALSPESTTYLVPRCERSHLGIERLVATIDRLSLERKMAPTQAIWRDALDELSGKSQPHLP